MAGVCKVMAGVCIIDAQVAGFTPQCFNFVFDVLLIIRNELYYIQMENHLIAKRIWSMMLDMNFVRMLRVYFEVIG